MKNALHARLGSSWLTTILSAALALPVAHPVRAAEPDIPQAKSSPEPSSIAQQIALAAAYLTGRGVTRDDRLAAYWYERAAEAGDPQAQKEIGYFYQIGLGVQQDPARAAHWYQLAAAAGLVSAKVNLGVAYVWGVGVPKNVKLGIQLFREAAKRGSGVADCYLGDVYYIGIGVDQDRAQGIKWYEKGAKAHEPRAEYDLASMLSKADNSAYDLPRAVEMLRHSAGEGFVPSMYTLGLVLVKHPQFAKSPDEALKLFESSSRAGNWRSSTVLGVLEREGSLVPQDTKRAYYHFRIAALQGGGPAARFLANDLQLLQNKLSSQDAAALDSQAEAWYQQHPLSLEFIYKDGENWKQFPVFALANPEAGSYAGQLVPTNPF